jgi:tetratricopeptide (TPR) repeat protein
MRALAVVVVVCGLAGIAHADRADALFKKGKKLLAEKKYAEACLAFEDSDRIDPGIGAKLNVARCYKEWGKLATAYRWFADAEQMAERAKDERAKQIQELVADLDPSVPRLTINVPRDANTAGIVIRLDGVELSASALGVERRVDPGPHQIDAIVDGEKQTKVVPVERGASSDVTLDLPRRRLTGGAPVQPAREPEPVADPYPLRRYLGLGTAGAGVVAIGIAEIVALRARGDYNRALSGHCNGATDQCDGDGVARTHSARHRANIATFVTLGGLVAVASGAFLYFTAPHPRVASDDHALYVAPSVGEANGLVLGGAF